MNARLTLLLGAIFAVVLVNAVTLWIFWWPGPWLWLLIPIATLVALIGTAFLYWEWGQNDMGATRVPEARARNIERAGTFLRKVWSFSDHVELEDGNILHKKHLYHPEASTSKGAFHRDAPLIDPIKGDLDYDFIRNPDVSYKVDRARRYPQKQVTVDIDIPNADDPKNPGQTRRVQKTVVLDMTQVFLDRNFNFMESRADEDRSLADLYTYVLGKNGDVHPDGLKYPADFFGRIERGFYFKLDDVTVNGKQYREKLTVDRVIVKVNDPVFIRSKVVAMNHSSGQIWGGWYWMGLPYLYSLFRYHQAWVSLLPTGEEERTDTKRQGLAKLKDILLSDDIYLIPIHGAEDKRLLRLDIMLLVKLRIVNPQKAMYQTQKVLENVTAIAGSVYRQLVSQYTFEEIISEKTELGQSWWKLFQIEISDPQNEDFFRRYGIWILSTDLWRVDVHGSEKYKDEIHEIQTQRFAAEQKRLASITEAEGKAKATQIYFESIRKHGSDGLQILFMQTLEKLGQKDGKMIVPFGDIGRYLSGTIGKSDEQNFFATLAAAGITGDMVISAMKKLADQKTAESSTLIVPGR